MGAPLMRAFDHPTVTEPKETDMISRIRRFGSAPSLAALMLAALWLAGCASQEPPPESETGSEPPPAAAAADLPRVFFVNVEDGGQYPTEQEIIFGVENFDIVPVEDPMVVRPGEGHYHLAVDVPCAAAGEIIVQGTPSYIHFGDGSDRITMQFDSGEHSLCLQVADGEHRVIAGPEHAGLTQEIHVTVVE